MANSSIYNAFERMWQHIVAKIGTKADIDHNHVVDSELSSTSTNPVQNKVVSASIQTLTDTKAAVTLITWESND